jgi:hypothetical protein
VHALDVYRHNLTFAHKVENIREEHRRSTLERAALNQQTRPHKGYGFLNGPKI